MANYKLNTQINRGKFKGKKVSELIEIKEGRNYLIKLHNGEYNVQLTADVLSALEKHSNEFSDCDKPLVSVAKRTVCGEIEKTCRFLIYQLQKIFLETQRL